MNRPGRISTCGQCGRVCAPSGYFLPGGVLLCCTDCVASWQAQEAPLGHRWDVRPSHGIGLVESPRTLQHWTRDEDDSWYAVHVNPIEILRGQKNAI